MIQIEGEEEDEEGEGLDMIQIEGEEEDRRR